LRLDQTLILFHHKRHPAEMGGDQIRQFLTHLAVEANVAASTQNQALCALLFLYRDVLRVELLCVEGIERAKRPARVPVVFTRQEVEALLAQLHGHIQTDQQPSLRLRAAADGGAALAHQRRGF
jgi:site-specific recombinase XerD